MSEARVFVPQEALERWVSEGKAELGADALTFEGQRCHMASAVRFLAEVAGGRDELGLVGRVKSLEQLAALDAEHAGTSVVIGDDAYQVVEGYLLSLVFDAREEAGTPDQARARDPNKLDLYPRIIALFGRS